MYLQICPFCGKQPYSRVVVSRGLSFELDNIVIEVGCKSCEIKQRTAVQSGESMDIFERARKKAFDKWNGRA